jgi:hypothetical protein
MLYESVYNGQRGMRKSYWQIEKVTNDFSQVKYFWVRRTDSNFKSGFWQLPKRGPVSFPSVVYFLVSDPIYVYEWNIVANLNQESVLWNNRIFRNRNE